MKYIDAIMDALMEVHIFEMAYQRKAVINKIGHLAPHIARHITKIALYPTHTARKHWENEIHAACLNISDLIYDGKKHLKEHEYFKLLHQDPIEGTNFTRHVAKTSIRADSMHDHQWSDSHISEIDNNIKNVYHTLSKQLASDDYEHISHTLKNNAI